MEESGESESESQDEVKDAMVGFSEDQPINSMSLLAQADPRKMDMISQVGELAEQLMALHESLIDPPAGEVSVTSVDGIKLVSAASDILQKAKLLEGEAEEEKKDGDMEDEEDDDDENEEVRSASCFVLFCSGVLTFFSFRRYPSLRSGKLKTLPLSPPTNRPLVLPLQSTKLPGG